MQIDREELLRRLKSSKNLANSLSESNAVTSEASEKEERPIIPSDNDVNTQSDAVASVIFPRDAKGPREPQLHNGIRIIAGSLAYQIPASEVADGLGITVKQVNSAKNSKNKDVRAGINRSLERVQELAIDKMMCALGLMSVDKFENAALKDLAIVAANMSRVIEKTRVQEVDNRVQLVLYAPESRSERSYKVLDV